MGSRTPEGHQQTPNGNNPQDAKPINPTTGAVSGNSASADVDRGIIGESDDDDDDDDDDDEKNGVDSHQLNSSGNSDKKKKRRRPKKKGKKSVADTALNQSSPPRVLLSTLFPTGVYPEGESAIYNEKTARTTDEEKRYTERQAVFDQKFLSDYRQAACAHRQVRQWAQKELIKPGNTLYDIAESIEDSVRALIGHQGLESGDSLKAGMAFPTGLCLNNTAAHSTPTPSGKKIMLQHEDVLKVDFGVHINGRIVDSAFTVAFDPVYDNLLASVKDATNTGVKEAGIDAQMSDIGAAVQEVMESYEVEIKGRTFPVKAIRNLSGHDIKPYQIHGDKQVPFVKNSSRTRMEEGEIFAIETFGSTGRGFVSDDIGIYGYGRNSNISAQHLSLSASAKSLLRTIDSNFGTIVFNARYLERLGVKRYHLDMRSLIANGIIETYAPLVDVQGSYTAQFEHTILLHSTHKEVISRGEDY